MPVDLFFYREPDEIEKVSCSCHHQSSKSWGGRVSPGVSGLTWLCSAAPCLDQQEQEEKATFTEPEVAAPEYVPAVDDAAFAAPAVVPSFEPVAGASASV